MSISDPKINLNRLGSDQKFGILTLNLLSLKNKYEAH